MVKKSKGFGDYGKKRRIAKKLGAENVFESPFKGLDADNYL